VIPDLEKFDDPSERAEHMNAIHVFADIPDFSLVLGGPLYQLLRRAHLSGDVLELVHRRVLAAVAIAWLPLLALSFPRLLTGGAVTLPFLHDLEAQVRFLIALPLLLVAEPIVHAGNIVLVRRFLDRRLIAPSDVPKFSAAISWALRVRNSGRLEAMLAILVWTAGHWLWRNQVALTATSWYASVDESGWRLTPAGYWAAFVSIPMFQFLLLRWYLRLVVWYGLLWRVSRLTLRLTATHPDRMGGLSFLGKMTYTFAPIMFAQGALLSGMIATRVLYEGANLMAFKLETGSLVGVLVLIVFCPLLMFSPQMAYAKRRGLGAYGRLASQYVQQFEDKWIRREAAGDEPLLGSGDIQSLADMGNSYEVVRDMRVAPFALDDVLRIAAVTAAPLLPVALTAISLPDLITRLVQILF
jgi:hypothetical protein